MGKGIHQSRAHRCPGKRRGSGSTSQNRSRKPLQAYETTRYRTMRRWYISALAFVLCARLNAQETESPSDSVLDLGSILYDNDQGGLTISSGKTYNRVEGLPVYLGTTYHNRIGHANISLAALGIIRSSNKFHWDPENLGHRLTAEVRIGRRRGDSLGAADVGEDSQRH